MTAGRPFDWDGLMRFGLGTLGLAPDNFWSMTPREFQTALNGRLGATADIAPLSRTALNTLIREHPDETATKDTRHER